MGIQNIIIKAEFTEGLKPQKILFEFNFKIQNSKEIIFQVQVLKTLMWPSSPSLTPLMNGGQCMIVKYYIIFRIEMQQQILKGKPTY